MQDASFSTGKGATIICYAYHLALPALSVDMSVT